MRLVRDSEPDLLCPEGSVVTIGHFDGLHRGHMALIHMTTHTAADLGLEAVMVSFDPMATEFFSRDEPPVRLINFSERWRLLRDTSLDLLWLMRFNAAMAATTAAEFEQRLIRVLKPRAIIVGADFRYGQGRQGDVARLETLGKEAGFELVQAPQVRTRDEQRISSSMVRTALGSGDLETAERLLGRPYAMVGRVVRGKQLGRRLGFPTANILLHRRRSPLHGIYAVRVDGPGLENHPAVASIGTRPTVGGGDMILEVHLFDYQGDLYGAHLTTTFVARIRDEEHYDDLDTMTDQIRHDVETARRLLDCGETT